MQDIRDPVRNRPDQFPWFRNRLRSLGELTQRHFGVIRFAKEFTVDPLLQKVGRRPPLEEQKAEKQEHRAPEGSGQRVVIMSEKRNRDQPDQSRDPGNPEDLQSCTGQQVLAAHAQQNGYVHSALDDHDISKRERKEEHQHNR